MAPADAPREIAPGQVVGGKWRIVRLIGRGGMGAVYEGQNTAIGKRVALKFIDPDYAGQPEIISRFQREAEAASVVESAHIVQVFDSGTTEQGIPYIVMELLQGEDLRSRLKRLRKLTPGEAVHIAAQMLRGLHRAHEAGIVHRDLKPDNVFLVDRDDEPQFAKIVDFGISKMMSRSDGVSVGTLTRQGMVLGTPYYMSPEQAQAVGDLDGRTDLWAVGAILYESLAGRPPFQGDAYEPIIVAICSADPPALRTLEPAVPERLAAVVHRALTRDRARRFQTAREMLDALEATELTRTSTHSPAHLHRTGIDAGFGSSSRESAAGADPSSGRTRVSWTQPDGGPAFHRRAHGETRRVRGPFQSRRALLGLGAGLMIATFLTTFAWLRWARRGSHSPSAIDASAERAPAQTASESATSSASPMGHPPTEVAAAGNEKPPAGTIESSATTRAVTVGAPHHAGERLATTAAPKKKSPTATPAPTVAPAVTPPLAGKPGVAGGLQIKTTYP
jgi:serine/threonine protein kinase